MEEVNLVELKEFFHSSKERERGTVRGGDKEEEEEVDIV